MHLLFKSYREEDEMVTTQANVVILFKASTDVLSALCNEQCGILIIHGGVIQYVLHVS